MIKMMHDFKKKMNK